jgi:hypothetical protein
LHFKYLILLNKIVVVIYNKNFKKINQKKFFFNDLLSHICSPKNKHPLSVIFCNLIKR